MPLYLLHLGAVFVVQLIIFIALVQLIGTNSRVRVKIIGLLALGVLFGFAYDILLGTYCRIFSYPGVTRVAPFLILNSVLSYGVAMCTAWVLPCTMTTHRSNIFRLVAAVALVGLAVSLVGILASYNPIDLSPLVRVFIVVL